MAQTVGNLSVFLSLNATGFSKGIDFARKHLGQFGKDFGSIRNLVAGGLGAVGIALTARAFQTMVAEQMKAIDATAKLSDSLGTTTENLQAFRDAASMSGAEAPDQLLSQLTKKIGEARQGSADAAKVFATLGLSVNDLANMDTVAAFGEVSKAINGLATAADRGAVAAKIFGDQGTKLGPLFAAGAEGIAAAKAQAELLGTSLSRIDAARVELANDAMDRLSQATRGLKQQIAVGLAFAIQDASDKMLAWLEKAGGSQNVVNAGFEKMARLIGTITDSGNFLLSVFYSMKAVLATITQGLAAILQAGAVLINTIVFGTALGLAKIGQGLANIAAMVPGMKDAAEAANAEFSRAAIELQSQITSRAAFAVETFKGLGQEAFQAGKKGLDAYDRFATGAGGKLVDAAIAAAKSKSDEMANAIVGGLPKAMAKIVPNFASSFADTLVSTDGLERVSVRMGADMMDSMLAKMDTAASRIATSMGAGLGGGSSAWDKPARNEFSGFDIFSGRDILSLRDGAVGMDAILQKMDTAASRIAVWGGTLENKIFSPGRLGAATYGSVEGFRASAGLQNQPMLTLQRESVRIEKEQRDLLTEIRDQNADTVTVSL